MSQATVLARVTKLCTELPEASADDRHPPHRGFVVKYVARHGWVNYFLDLPDRPVDWAEVAELVRDSYRIQAPKRLTTLLGDG